MRAIRKPARRRHAAVLVAISLAGCAAQAPVDTGGVKVVPVEQSAWNRPPEPGLFRITWDAARTGELRGRVAPVAAPEGLGTYTAERLQLDEEADRQLKARGLCENGSARLVALLDDGATSSGISGIFKCLLAVF